VIGAGPVGLAAAAHLLERGLEPIVFEAGAVVGASVREWGHVRVFSPWQFNIDPAAECLLDAAGWERPEADGYPTGEEIVERYLEPLAALPQIAERLRHCWPRLPGATAPLAPPAPTATATANDTAAVTAANRAMRLMAPPFAGKPSHTGAEDERRDFGSGGGPRPAAGRRCPPTDRPVNPERSAVAANRATVIST
jgi:glycine/D-amino acid oxidase-like deaminating enzyme